MNREASAADSYKSNHKHNFILNVFVLIIAAAIAALMFSLHAMSIHWWYPILDHDGFRQSQTALSVYWMIHEGHFLAYRTPVLGYPWTIPFEFPLYQWIVFFCYKLGFFPLDQCGRFVSVVCFYLTLLPIYFLTRSFHLGIRFYLIFLILYLMSPVYLFWSRTFLIESLSLFLALWFLALVQSYLNRPRWIYFFGAIVIGSLGIMVKITTFLPFEILAAIFVVFDWSRVFRFKITRRGFLKYLPVTTFVIIPFFALLSWTHYADALKLHNIFTNRFISGHMEAWNFGAFNLRFSPEYWGRIFFRSFSQGIGSGIILIYLVLIYIFWRHVYVKAALLFFFVYLSGFLIFANLHYVQVYYDYENTIFLIVMCALLLETLLKEERYYLSLFFLLVTLGAQYEFYVSYYGFFTQHNTFKVQQYEVGRFISTHTKVSSMIFVYGDDWSSSIAYYAERKSLTYPIWAEDHPEILGNWKSFTGGVPVGAVVVCSQGFPLRYQISPHDLNHLTDGMRLKVIQGCDVYFK